MTSKLFKGALACVMCTLCILGSTVLCGAASQNYILKELDDLSITLPDGMSAVTRSTSSGDKYFSVFGLDYNTTMDNFKNGDIYLQGMDDTSSITVTVTMTKTDESQGIKNYTLLDSDKLTEVEGNFLNQSEYSACTPDQSADKKIVWLMFNTNVIASGSSIKAYQAHTVYDGMSINITLQRNGSNVTDADYNTFSGIVSTVSFGKESAIEGLVPVIAIGATVILIIIVIILVIAIKSAKRRGKKNRNNQIISELADKYNLDSKKKSKKKKHKEIEENSDGLAFDISTTDSTANKESSDYIESEMFSEDLQEQMKSDYIDEDNANHTKIFNRKALGNVATDEEIDEIISSAHSYEDNAENIIYSENEKAEEISEPSEVAPAEDESSSEESIENATEAVAEDTDTAENSEASANADGFEEYTDEDSEDTETVLDEEADLTEDGLTEADEFNNDEELVREQARKTKFSDSYDFFEEAPKKTMGIISNKELDDAEDYDVITEIEQKATKVEKPEPEDVDAGEPIGDKLKRVGAGFKNFGIHCGYFCTNVYRMIKRKRAIAKRKKAEQERLERQRARAERQRQQRRAGQDGSLVQVHSRTDRRPPQNRGSQSRRPAPNGTRRPASSQTRRPSGSASRRPSNQPQSRNRRPDNRPRR